MTTALPDLPLALTVEETASVLRIGRSAAYQAVKSGQIPSIRIGRSVRVPRHLLERMLLGPVNESDPAGKPGLTKLAGDDSDDFNTA